MVFRKIEKEDEEAVKEVSALASSIVKEHYDPLLGAEQNDYMIEMFQSVPAILGQLEHGYQYYMVCNDEGEGIGFLAFYKREKDVYLSKFYLHKNYRGKGLSREMLKFVADKTKEAGFASFELNVNKHNSAVLAYERLGLVRVRSEVNDIGHGYVMDDYVYRYEVGSDAE